MLYNSCFQQDFFEMMKDGSHKRMVRILSRNGAKQKIISDILVRFFDSNVMFREIFKKAQNEEAVIMRDQFNKLAKQYGKAARALESILADQTISEGTRTTIIKRDLEYLKKRQDFFLRSLSLQAKSKPAAESIQQIIVFQSWALFRYLKKFKMEEPDYQLYAFICDLLKIAYRQTILASAFQGLTGEKLKKNFADNADKLSAIKNGELEETFKELVK